MYLNSELDFPLCFQPSSLLFFDQTRPAFAVTSLTNSSKIFFNYKSYRYDNICILFLSINMNIQLNTSDENIEKIYHSLNLNGMHCIENSVPKNLIDEFRKKINEYLNENGNRYFSKINPADEPTSAFSSIKNSRSFVTLINKLASKALNRKIEDSEGLNVLRVITGKNAETQTLQFHYDAYAVTALIPIFIPEGKAEESGHLVALLNLRKFRNMQIINMIEKALFQNRFTRKFLSFLVFRNQEKYIHKMIPGNIYLFWGYRTLHANLGVNKDLLRSTLLFHGGDVHQDSYLDKIVKRKRHASERKNDEIKL